MDRLVDRSLSATLVTPTSHDALPARAGTVVIGGGIIGASIAHHLASAGVDDVLLLERDVLTSGTSWHAAGLVAGGRTSTAMTQLASYGLGMYANLGERSGVDVSFARSGSLSIARTPGRVDELQYACDVARQNGVEARLVGTSEIERLWPLSSITGMLCGLHFPDDGHVNPGYAALAFATLAHRSGVAIREGVTVTRILHERGRVTGVETEKGTVHADTVVIAGGLWSRDVAATAGVHLPLYAAEHVHVRSGEIAGAVAELPVLRDLDNSYYIRHEAGRLLVGAFEPNGLPRAVDDIPSGGFATFPEDWEHIAPVRAAAESTVPALRGAGYDRFLNAPESFTPDTSFLLGETAEVERLYVAAGMNSQGIIYAPGVGAALADWIIAGAPQFDTASVDVQRFSPHQSNRRYLHARTTESLGRLYAMHWPHFQSQTARDVRRTPLHDRLAGLGARFGELNGGERANWYGGPPAAEGYSYGRPGWFDQVATEHRAAREGVTLFDLSPFAKFEVSGPDALAVCQRVATNDVDVAVGTAVYTLFLNRGGGIELDGTITRIEEDRFLVCHSPRESGTEPSGTCGARARGRAAAVTDVVTAACATIGRHGARSRELIGCACRPRTGRCRPAPTRTAASVEVGRRLSPFTACAIQLRLASSATELYPWPIYALNCLDGIYWGGAGSSGCGLGGLSRARLRLRSEKRLFRHPRSTTFGAADDPLSRPGYGSPFALRPSGWLSPGAKR